MKNFLLAVLAVVVAIALYMPRWFTIPSGSDIPTLMVGDVIAAGRFSYGISAASLSLPADLFKGRFLANDPERGDIAMFLRPQDRHTIYVKRVIGLPGDRIQMREGRLYINGVVAPREPTTAIAMKDDFGRDRQVPTYIETLPNGAKYRIVEIHGDNDVYDNTPEFTVPPGHYFTMGDNRDNSDDSRDMTQMGVGFVPAENFVAKAWFVLLSTQDTGRMFKPIR